MRVERVSCNELRFIRNDGSSYVSCLPPEECDRREAEARELMGQQQAPSVNSAFVTNSPPSFGPTFNASMPAGTLDLPTLNFDPREHFAKPELLGLNTFAAAYPPQQQPQQQPQPVTPQGQNYFGAQGVVNSVPTEVLEIPTLNFDDQRFGRPKQQSRDMVENNQADDGLLHLPQMTW